MTTKKHASRALLALGALLSSSAVFAGNNALDAPILGGKKGLSCQVLLCLSDPAGQNIPACKGPLNYFNALKSKQKSPFLALCPKSGGK